MSRSTLTILCLTMLVVQPHKHAHAFDLFGYCLSGDCKKTTRENDVIDPKSYQVDLNLRGDVTEDVDLAIKSATELWRGREKAVAGSAGLLARAKGDYRRLLAGLYNEGYYGGEISILINGVQASAMKPGIEFPDDSIVTVSIDTGDVYRFGTFDIFNRAPNPQGGEDIVEKPDTLKVARGDIAKARSVGIAGRLAVEEWRQQGYPHAKIGGQTVKAQHDKNILNVNLSIDPGERSDYGATRVEGTERMDEAFVAYMTGLKTGEEYDPDDIEDAKARLDKLDVFSVRKVETGEENDQEGKVPINVEVREKKLRRIGLGATVSSIDGAGLSAFWLNRNLFGRAERLRLDGEISGIGSSSSADELDFKLSATFTKPGVFTPNTDSVTKIFAEREFNTSFEGETGGFSSILTHQLSRKINVAGGGFYEYSRFKDAFGTRNFSTLGVSGEIAYDGRDSKVDPTKDALAKIEVKPFYEFEQGNAGVRLDGELRAYKTLDSDGDTVLAARVKVGSVIGPSRDQVPTNFLYLSGGGGSIRGFGFNNVGIVDSSGNVSGGRSLLETSVELRHKFTDTLGGVAFIDGGIVGEDPIIDFSQDFSVSAGIGARYYTPLGPIRLDVAVPLNPKSSDPDFGIFAGIGQAF